MILDPYPGYDINFLFKHKSLYLIMLHVGIVHCQMFILLFFLLTSLFQVLPVVSCTWSISLRPLPLMFWSERRCEYQCMSTYTCVVNYGSARLLDSEVMLQCHSSFISNQCNTCSESTEIKPSVLFWAFGSLKIYHLKGKCLFNFVFWNVYSDSFVWLSKVENKA